MVQIWLRYDLRSPSIGIGSVALAAAAIEQVAWADDKGFHTIQLPEHHCSEDDYNPSPLVLGAAMASRTSKLRIQPSAIILPLHDPIRIAEDCCVVDIISNGRLDVTIGLGYVPDEFDMFGIPLSERGQILDKKLAALKQAFTGETFEYEGRKVKVTPPPVQKGGPRLFIGGSVKATARRAAQYGDGYYPMFVEPELVAEYHRLCAEAGKEPGPIINGAGPKGIYVARDPDRAWAKIGPHALHEANGYAEFAAKLGQRTSFRAAENPDALRASGDYRVLTPEEAVIFFREQESLGRHVTVAPLVAGLDPDVAWESLELIASEVIPVVSEALSQPAAAPSPAA